MKIQKSLVLLLAVFIFSSILGAQIPKGTLKGKVVNSATKEPLIGVNVILDGAALGAATGTDGFFVVENVPAGSYKVTFMYMGFSNLVKTDVQVNPGRISFINAEMKETIVEGEEVTVTAGYFHEDAAEPVSIYSFNAEEVRRSPGSAGDVSRILMALPSAAKVADNSNDLMVRGGSPMENAFFIDNIQLPNINHFPVQGATGGPIGILNVDLIDDVKFYTGGFSAAYGDRLSSVVDIEFREGSREKFESQLDFNMSGFGGLAEGPLGNGKGSWILTGRRSFLDMITGAIGTGVAPRYGDVHGKLTYDLNASNRLTVLNVFGASAIKYKQDEAADLGQSSFGDYFANQNTFGLNWRTLWKSRGYSNTSLSYTFVKSNDDWYHVNDGKNQQASTYYEGWLRFRNVNYFQVDKKNKFEFGLDASMNTANYDYTFNEYTTRLGDVVPSVDVNKDVRFSTGGLFFNYSWQPMEKLTTNWGVRADYFSHNKSMAVSPRLSARLQLNERIALNAGFGEFYQTLPAIILTQNSEFKELNNPKATHYIVGMEWLATSDTKISLEAYYKKYENFPLDPSDPSLFVVDEGRSMSYFRFYEQLVDEGEASAHGIEFLIQKKLAKDFYGLISASYFRSRYRDFNGVWLDRVYDNQYLFSVIGGYKPNNKWEFSLRWNYAGGVPYTPFDIEQSTKFNVGIIDQSRINEARYPDYHTLNIRVDRRFFFQSSSIVAYMSLWNAYNRQNVAMYYWNEVDNEPGEYYQWSFIPIGGIEWEF